MRRLKLIVASCIYRYHKKKNVDQIIAWCNELTPELYYDLLPVIEDNYQRSMAWMNKTQQVETMIEELIK